MPFYDFRCPSCGHKEAHFRKIEQRESRLCFQACMDSWPGRLATRGISP